jgi:hypothetical protein
MSLDRMGLCGGMLPTTCILTTPTQYLDALKQGHAIAWAQVTNGSATAFGPNDHTPQADAAENGLPPDDPFNTTRQLVGGFGGGFVHLPFQTNNNSTVLRIGLRYAIGFEGQMPLAWGGWPAPPCHELNCLMPSMWGGMQTAWAFSQPFVLQIVPARFVQFRFLPTNILYQPPGNESTASLLFQAQYSQGYEVDQASSITDQLSYDRVTKGDVSFGPTVGGSISSEAGTSGENKDIKLPDSVVGGTGNLYASSTSWDSLAASATGESYGMNVSTLVTTGLSHELDTPAPTIPRPDYSHLTFDTEPFWSDMFYIAVHPQFAVWDLPQGVLLQPMGSAGTAALSVKALAGCLPKPGNPMSSASGYTLEIWVPKGSVYVKEQEQLSGLDCARLLALDPFFVALSQAIVPRVGIPVAGTEFLVPTVSQHVSTQMATFNTTGIYTKTIKASVSSVRQSTFSQGISEGASLFGTIGVAVSASGGQTKSTTSSDEYTVTLGTTQTTSTQQTFTATIRLGDCPVVSSGGMNSLDCGQPAAANPPSVAAFQDTRFGTMMAALPGLAIKPPGIRETLRDVTALLPIGLTAQHLSALQGSGSPNKSEFVIRPSRLPLAKESIASRNPAPPILTSQKGYGASVPVKWRQALKITAQAEEVRVPHH